MVHCADAADLEGDLSAIGHGGVHARQQVRDVFCAKIGICQFQVIGADHADRHRNVAESRGARHGGRHDRVETLLGVLFLGQCRR